MIDVNGVAGADELLVALDFDGTLAPIVDVPGEARALPGAVAAINGLAALPRTTVVLVSGRALADLVAVSGFGPPVRFVGSHGLELDDGSVPLDDEQRARLDRLAAEVAVLVDGTPGARVERKPAGLAVHVRGLPVDAGERLLDALAVGPGAAPGIVITPGKAVLDLAVTDVTKGLAIERLRGGATVFFAGDDVTDETALARLRPGDLGVKVGEGDTAATHRVTDPEALTKVLTDLLAARTTA